MGQMDNNSTVIQVMAYSAIRQQAITWTNLDRDLCECMTLAGCNELKSMMFTIDVSVTVPGLHWRWTGAYWIHPDILMSVHLDMSVRSSLDTWFAQIYKKIFNEINSYVAFVLTPTYFYVLTI